MLVQHVLAIHVPFLDEWGIIILLGLLFFGGKRLPEMGRSLGKGIIEFKKGLKGIQDDIDEAGEDARVTPTSTTPPPPVVTTTVQQQPPQIANQIPPGAKFDPYTGKPLESETTKV